MKDESSQPITPEVERLPVATGQVIGERYRIGEILGMGGMGVVCSATHVLLGTPVAVKIIHSDLKHDSEAVLRFVYEARATAALKGEHIARVFDAGQLPSGEPYLVMEQLNGVGLDQYLDDQGPLGLGEAVDIVLQACEGLAEAHALSLVHRDIKPANLFLARKPDGHYSVKVLDFGIAKRLLADTRRGLTNPGKSLGSPWYMSPEQMLSPSLVDQRSDIWSLGVLLFELLTATPPFDGATVPQVCASVLTQPTPLLSDRRPDLPLELDRVLLRCLEKKPEQRLPSISALSDALLPFASELRTSTRGSNETPSLVGQRAAHSPSRSRRWLGASAGVLALLLLGIGWTAWQRPELVRELRKAQLALPWDPRLKPDVASPDPTGEVKTPTLLQKLELAHAVRDDGSPASPPPEPDARITPEEAHARAQRYELWLKSQGLTRIDEPAPE